MPRPTINPDALVTSMEGWDALVRDMIRAMSQNPYPVPQFANLASLPAASDYSNCLACTADTHKLYFSNGTVWKEANLL